jgi:hypothetical protein
MKPVVIKLIHFSKIVTVMDIPTGKRQNSEQTQMTKILIKTLFLIKMNCFIVQIHSNLILMEMEFQMLKKIKMARNQLMQIVIMMGLVMVLKNPGGLIHSMQILIEMDSMMGMK